MSEMEKQEAAQAAAQESAPKEAPKPEESAKGAPEGKAAGKAKEKGGKKEKDKKPGLFAQVSRWFREMRSELKKVSWPSGRDTMKNVAIVIVCVLVVGVVIGAFDVLVRAVVEALLDLF